MLVDRQKTTLRRMERAIRKDKYLQSHPRVVMDLWRLLEFDTMRRFVGSFKRHSGRVVGERVDDDIWLEFVKSRYMSGGMCLS